MYLIPWYLIPYQNPIESFFTRFRQDPDLRSPHPPETE